MTGHRERALSPRIHAIFRRIELPYERDGVDVAPVVALLAVGRAAVAEEPRRIRVGAVPEVLDPAHAGGGEARGDIAGKIEQGVLRSRRRAEEPFVGPVLCLEASDEFGPDLVILSAGGRPQRARNPGPGGPPPLHGG